MKKIYRKYSDSTSLKNKIIYFFTDIFSGVNSYFHRKKYKKSTSSSTSFPINWNKKRHPNGRLFSNKN
jgi:hypothetical protein